MLAEGRESSLQIQSLAEKLDISKNGFYWHFQNRRAFLDALIEYWANEFTASIIQLCENETLPPHQKIRKISRVIREERAEQYDLSFWNWALTDAKVKLTVEGVRDAREKYICEQIAALGYSGKQLEARTRLFVVCHSWGSTMFDTRINGDEAVVTEAIIDVIVG